MKEKISKLTTTEQEIKKVSDKQLYPIIDLYRNAPDKHRFMKSMKEGGININGENITPIDFFATSENLSDEEIIGSIEGYLDIESIEGNLELLNESMETAKDYIVNYLHQDLPSEIRNLDGADNVNDVLKIFKKTAALKKGEGLKTSPFYCALISVAAASFEFKKEKLESLIEESGYMYEKMFEEDEKTGIKHLHKLHFKRGEYDKILFYDDQAEEDGKKNITADAYFRGKNEYSFISKMINKPEVNAEEASKDGIGLKFELKSEEEIGKLVVFLNNYLKEKFNAEQVILENDKLFKESDEVYSEIDKIQESDNPNSNENFRAFKINGKIKIPKKGKSEAMELYRQFEVQIVLANSKNESKFSNHHIYEAAKKLAVFTRLFGSLTEKHLDAFSEEASAKTNMSKDKIKEYLKDTFLVGFSIKGYKKKRYVHKNHLDRHTKAKLIPEKIKPGERKNNLNN